MPNPLPTFERPPLDEMAMGVQFDPLADFRAAHFGLYWARIREEYPHTEDQPPLASIVEAKEIGPSATNVTAQLLAAPLLPRCWFLNASKTKLIQLQQERFLRNWRRLEGNEPYPHFGPLAAEFMRAWKGFLAFASEENLGPVKVNQCELTYVDDIERGVGWSEPGELTKVFPFLRAPGGGAFLPSPEMMTWQARYKLPDGRGRLHIDMRPAFRGKDLKLILKLSFTARGAPAEGSPDQIFAWFELAHEWVNRAFDELTGTDVQKLWGKRT